MILCARKMRAVSGAHLLMDQPRIFRGVPHAQGGAPLPIKVWEPICGPGHQTRASRVARSLGTPNLLIPLRGMPGSDDPGHKARGVVIFTRDSKTQRIGWAPHSARI